MKRERGDYSQISQGILKVLINGGMTLTQVAKMLGLSKSYVSRVNAGTRSFTLDHIADLERKTRLPLPLLVMQATPIRTVKPELRPLYRIVMRTLERSYGKAPAARRRRAKAA